MKAIGNILKYIAIFILTCAIIFLVLINIVSSTILNKQYILNKLEETNYYSKMQEEIESSFENYIGQSGLDEDVIKDIVSMEKIKADTNLIIENVYDGSNKTIDTSEIETNLKSKIEKSLENKKLTITQQKAIEEYIQTIAKQYKDTMLHNKYENNINGAIKKINTYLETGKKGIIIGIAVVAFIIMILNYKKIIRSVSNIGIALFSSGIFYIILNIYINLKIKVSNIVLLNEAVSNAVKTIVNDIFSKITTQGIILAICGIIMIILGNVIINLNKTKERGEYK